MHYLHKSLFQIVVEGDLCVIFHAFSFFLFLSLMGYHLILKLIQLFTQSRGPQFVFLPHLAVLNKTPHFV